MIFSGIKLLFSKKIRRTTQTRLVFFIIGDTLLIVFSVWLAFLLRFDGKIPSQYLNGNLQMMIVLALIFCLPIFYLFKLYSFSWSYVSAQELISLLEAVGLSFLFSSITFLIFRDFPQFSSFPRSTLFISYFLIFLFSGAIRFSKRIYLQSSQGYREEKERTLIIGAGDAGEQILRSIQASKSSPYSPIGFIDDNPIKQGIIIHGLKVLGKIDEIPKIIKERQVEEMIIALPSVGSEIIKKAVISGREAGLKKIKVVPPIAELIDDQISFRNVREIQVEDLLGREPVLLDTKSIENFIQGKKILITGAAGSIGAELSRQVAKFNPSSLLVLDQDETGIFNILRELKRKFPRLEINFFVAHIQDEEKTNQIFSKFSPHIVFHAAAYKHVSLMEAQPGVAVKNNVLGTKIVAEAALRHNVEKFIFISTDKAVNPSSIMGATKRAGEMVCQVLSQENSTKFISVRFGNVLDSRGSVIPIFREQIKKGGPVQVTDPEMKRYFMTTSEACLLVMQASEMGQGGEVFVLDMGKAIRILDLAKEMIRLSGFEPDKDIPIVFIGKRPGEKLFEEILSAEEGTVATKHQKIFRAKLSKMDGGELKEGLIKIEKAVRGHNQKEVVDILKKLVPFYRLRA